MYQVCIFNMSTLYVEEEFKKVTYKGKSKRFRGKTTSTNENLNIFKDPDFDKETTIRRIEEAKTDLIRTDFYDSVSASLREGFSNLSNCKVSEIICLGLGKIGECLISRYQFALLLCLRDLCDTQISVFDPVFSCDEISILEHYACKTLTENSEGKYKVKNKHTLFYLPHCPKQLTNNLLWCNWGLDLSYCIIISNSFNKIIENTTKRELQQTGQYISNIFPYTLELAVVNSFKYYEVFNDLAIHIFPLDKLNFISEDFWKFSTEPKYTDEDVEFIRSILEKNTLS